MFAINNLPHSSILLGFLSFQLVMGFHLIQVHDYMRYRRQAAHFGLELYCGAPKNSSVTLDSISYLDRCCHTHDMCPLRIPPRTYNSTYNLFNKYNEDLVSCQCEEEFYRCLKGENTPRAGEMCETYFTIYKLRKCINYDYEIKHCQKYFKTSSMNVPVRCEIYDIDNTSILRWDLFDLLPCSEEFPYYNNHLNDSLAANEQTSGEHGLDEQSEEEDNDSDKGDHNDITTTSLNINETTEQHYTADSQEETTQNTEDNYSGESTEQYTSTNSPEESTQNTEDNYSGESTEQYTSTNSPEESTQNTEVIYSIENWEDYTSTNLPEETTQNVEGENAEEYNSLSHLHRCSYNHYTCPLRIPARTYNSTYNLFNKYRQDLLSCQCEEEFYKCLKEEETPRGAHICEIYFPDYKLRKCINYDYQITHCRKYYKTIEMNVPVRCAIYDLDETSIMRWDLFDLLPCDQKFPHFNNHLNNLSLEETFQNIEGNDFYNEGEQRSTEDEFTGIFTTTSIPYYTSEKTDEGNLSASEELEEAGGNTEVDYNEIDSTTYMPDYTFDNTEEIEEGTLSVLSPQEPVETTESTLFITEESSLLDLFKIEHFIDLIPEESLEVDSKPVSNVMEVEISYFLDGIHSN